VAAKAPARASIFHREIERITVSPGKEICNVKADSSKIAGHENGVYTHYGL
jgi:hypothetical protein